MTIFTLKIIALTTMVIDHFAFLHIGTLDNFYEIFRHIGRISFPLYVFIITESLFYTRDRKQFLKNLLLFAFISQVPFSLYFGSTLLDLNVLFTLFMGSVLVCLYDNFTNSLKQKDMYIMILVMVLCLFINSDYGFKGCYFVLTLYAVKKLTKHNSIASTFTMLFMVFFIYGTTSYFIFGCIPAILVYFYNGLEGYKFKKFFHWSYPIHIAILLVIKVIFLQ